MPRQMGQQRRVHGHGPLALRRPGDDPLQVGFVQPGGRKAVAREGHQPLAERLLGRGRPGRRRGHQQVIGRPLSQQRPPAGPVGVAGEVPERADGDAKGRRRIGIVGKGLPHLVLYDAVERVIYARIVAESAGQPQPVCPGQFQFVGHMTSWSPL